MKKVELPVSTSRQKILTKKHPHHEDSPCESPTKKVRFMDNTEPSSILSDGDDLHIVQSAVKKAVKKKCTLVKQRERKTAMRMKEKSKKDNFFSQMMQVQCNQLYRLRFAHQFLAQMLEAKVS